MAVGYARTSAAPTDAERRLADFTELVATAVANAQAQAELTASRARIVAASDQARRRIERNLHDGAQQRLVTLALMLSGIRETVPADIQPDVDEARDELTVTRREIRELFQRPASGDLGRGGPRGGHPCYGPKLTVAPSGSTSTSATTGGCPDHVEVSAYYMVAEALTNVAEHHHASAVTVKGGIDGDVLHITVRDDGDGRRRLCPGHRPGRSPTTEWRRSAAGSSSTVPPERGATLRAEFPLTVAAGGIMPRSPFAPHFPSPRPKADR